MWAVRFLGYWWQGADDFWTPSIPFCAQNEPYFIVAIREGVIFSCLFHRVYYHRDCRHHPRVYRDEKIQHLVSELSFGRRWCTYGQRLPSKFLVADITCSTIVERLTMCMESTWTLGKRQHQPQRGQVVIYATPYPVGHIRVVLPIYTRLSLEWSTHFGIHQRKDTFCWLLGNVRWHYQVSSLAGLVSVEFPCQQAYLGRHGRPCCHHRRLLLRCACQKVRLVFRVVISPLSRRTFSWKVQCAPGCPKW